MADRGPRADNFKSAEISTQGSRPAFDATQYSFFGDPIKEDDRGDGGGLEGGLGEGLEVRERMTAVHAPASLTSRACCHTGWTRGPARGVRPGGGCRPLRHAGDEAPVP